MRRAKRHLAVTLLTIAITQGAGAASFFPTAGTDAVDANPGDGICATAGGGCSLRAAVMEANALAGPDTVNMLVSTYTLTIPGTAADTASEGDLFVSEDLIFIGTSTVTSSYFDDLFTVGEGSTLRFNNTTLLPSRSGVTLEPGGRLELNSVVIRLGVYGVNNHCGEVDAVNSSFEQNRDSGIISYRNSTTLGECDPPFAPDVTMTNSQIIDFGSSVLVDEFGRFGVTQQCGLLNVSGSTISGGRSTNPNFGDGISYDTQDDRRCLAATARTVTISGSTFTDNGDDGVQVVAGALPFEVDISTSSFTDNRGSGFIAVGATDVEASDSLFSGNGDAGIKLQRSTATISNSTLSGNRNIRPLTDPLQNPGGGLQVSSGSSAAVSNATISGNLSTSGGGIYVDSASSGSLSNSILSNNLATTFVSPDCDIRSFGFTSGGGNLIGNGADCTLFGGVDQVGASAANIDPLLCALDDNGGSTRTHALDDASPARDAGNPKNCEDRDQRGAPRPLDGDNVPGAICDVGAFEALPQESFDCDSPPPAISLFAVREPSGVRLEFNGASSDSCLLTTPESDFSMSIDPAVPGSVTVDPSVATTYTLSCTSADGAVAATIEALTCDFISVIAPPASVAEEVAPPEASDIFAVDTATGKVIRIERDSGDRAVVNPSAGCLVAGAATGLALDSRLDLYVVQSAEPTLVKIDAFTGVELDATIAGSFLDSPTDVTVSVDGQIFVLEDSTGTVIEVAPDTLVQTAILSPGSFSNGRAITARGETLLVSDDDEIVEVDPQTMSISGTLPTSGVNPLLAPAGLAVLENGQALVIDPTLGELLLVDEAGTSTISSNADMMANPFINPSDVAVDLNSQYLVSDGPSILSIETGQGLRGVVTQGDFSFSGIAVLPASAIETFETLPAQLDDVGVMVEGIETFSVTSDGLPAATSKQTPNVVLTVSGPLAQSVRVDTVDDNEVVVLVGSAGTTGPDSSIMDVQIPGAAETAATGPFQDFFSQPADVRNATLRLRAGPPPTPDSLQSRGTAMQIVVELDDENGETCSMPAMPLGGALQDFSVTITAANCGGALSIDLSRIVGVIFGIEAASAGSTGSTEIAIDDIAIVPSTQNVPEPGQALLQGVALVALACLSGRKRA